MLKLYCRPAQWQYLTQNLHSFFNPINLHGHCSITLVHYRNTICLSISDGPLYHRCKTNVEMLSRLFVFSVWMFRRVVNHPHRTVVSYIWKNERRKKGWLKVHWQSISLSICMSWWNQTKSHKNDKDFNIGSRSHIQDQLRMNEKRTKGNGPVIRKVMLNLVQRDSWFWKVKRFWV